MAPLFVDYDITSYSKAYLTVYLGKNGMKFQIVKSFYNINQDENCVIYKFRLNDNKNS